MLLVHAGNRVDGPGRPGRRFPADHVADVRTRVARLLAALRPEAVVSSSSTALTISRSPRGLSFI